MEAAEVVASVVAEAEASAEVEAEASVEAEAVIEAVEVAAAEAEVEVPQEAEYNSKERGRCSEDEICILGECYNNLTPCFFGWLFVLPGPYGTARKNVPIVP